MSRKWKIVSSWVSAIVVIDQLTKAIIDRTLPLHRSISLIDGFLALTYIRNTGAAFGIFSGSHEVFRRPFLIGVSVIAIGFILVMLKRLRDDATGLAMALAFIVGGAIGNLIDRIFYGEVIDFLDLYWSTYHWPAFNVADSFITIGVAITLFYLIQSKGDDPFAAQRAATACEAKT